MVNFNIGIGISLPESKASGWFQAKSRGWKIWGSQFLDITNTCAQKIAANEFISKKKKKRDNTEFIRSKKSVFDVQSNEIFSLLGDLNNFDLKKGGTGISRSNLPHSNMRSF